MHNETQGSKNVNYFSATVQAPFSHITALILVTKSDHECMEMDHSLYDSQCSMAMVSACA
ncbi:hypothetical protein K0M31_017908 [Melipona bicolor]|uniref:Uncharacterized protein n=1 Tax=Melipona bicolor TaxID=60889 RepID=A0AA40G5R5_9HYME|nr:hypothetical protein K0M31_017908 [Melipona bicolor]